MLDPQITTVLFDLDGTLLPMELEAFTKTYFGLLAKKAAPYGYDPEPLVAAVWKGTKAMVKNDGSKPNDQAFWDTFAQVLGEDVKKLRPEFDTPRSSTAPKPPAGRIPWQSGRWRASRPRAMM